MRVIPILVALGVVASAFWWLPSSQAKDAPQPGSGTELRLYSVEQADYFHSAPVVKSDAEWKAELTAEQYHILREQGTERAYTGAYWKSKGHGVYRCAACGLDLYHSNHKYDSGTGWPSYYQPVAAENVATRADRSYFMVRNELVCARCESHLGHVFDDGPAPTGKRHCINSASLTFVALKK